MSVTDPAYLNANLDTLQSQGQGMNPHTVFLTDTGENGIDVCWIYNQDLTVEKMKETFGRSHLPHIVISRPGKDGWPADEDMKYHTITPDAQLDLHHERCKKHFVDYLRPARNNELARLDGEFFKNMEQGADNSTILQRKQILRDMPKHPVWDTCETLDDYKSINISHIT